MTIFSKSPYLTAYIKINYETGCLGRFSEKTQRCIQDNHGSLDGELFVTLVSSFSYLGTQTVFTSKFSGSRLSPSFTSTIV